jgi:hypothetical protein
MSMCDCRDCRESAGLYDDGEWGEDGQRDEQEVLAGRRVSFGTPVQYEVDAGAPQRGQGMAANEGVEGRSETEDEVDYFDEMMAWRKYAQGLRISIGLHRDARTLGVSDPLVDTILWETLDERTPDE